MTLHCTIGELERLLLGKYPAQDAESWDRTGLLAGDPSCMVSGVAVALDPSVHAIEQAKQAGANVLLTHHPAFLQPPESFLPGTSVAQQPGALIYAALEKGVALMNFHTALDMNEEGLMALPNALGLDYVRTVQPLPGATDTGRGYGALCSVGAVSGGGVPGAVVGETADGATGTAAAGDAGEAAGASDAFVKSVCQLAQVCKQALGGTPRIWGDVQAPVRYVVTAQGSAGSILPDVLALDVDCLICGELKYHDALAYAQAGLNIIEVGHDVSEQPLADVLYRSVRDLGVENVVELPRTANWISL